MHQLCGYSQFVLHDTWSIWQGLFFKKYVLLEKHLEMTIQLVSSYIQQQLCGKKTVNSKGGGHSTWIKVYTGSTGNNKQ